MLSTKMYRVGPVRGDTIKDNIDDVPFSMDIQQTETTNFDSSSSSRTTIPTAFIIITVIVGALWYVGQLGGLNIFQIQERDVDETGNVLKGDLVFFNQSAQNFNTESLPPGIIAYSFAEETLSNVLPVDEDLTVASASFSTKQNALARVVRTDEGNSILIDTVDDTVESILIEEAREIFLSPVWSHATNELAYTSISRGESSEVTGVVQEDIPTATRIQLGNLEKVDLGEAIALSFSPSSEELLVSTREGLALIDAGGNSRAVEGLDTFLVFFGSVISSDGQYIALSNPVLTVIAEINWEKATAVILSSLEGINPTAIFNNNNELLLVDEESITVYTFANGAVEEDLELNREELPADIKLLNWSI